MAETKSTDFKSLFQSLEDNLDLYLGKKAKGGKMIKWLMVAGVLVIAVGTLVIAAGKTDRQGGDGRRWQSDGRRWRSDGRRWRSDGQRWRPDGRRWRPAVKESPAANKDKPAAGEETDLGGIPSGIPLALGGSTQKSADGTFAQTEYFNSIAGDQDMIIFTESSLDRDVANHLEALRAVRKGLVVQNFASVEAARKYLPQIAGEIDIVGYDLERWDKAGGAWQDIAGASRAMADLAASYGLLYSGHLSFKLAGQNKSNPRSVEEMVGPVSGYYSVSTFACLEKMSFDDCVSLTQDIIGRAKNANPKVKILLNVSAEKDIDAADQKRFIEANAGQIDAVGIFSFANRETSLAKVKELVAMIRN